MFTLPKLQYKYDSLEPFIDSQTMEIHHTKHHQTYIDKLNETLTDFPEFQNLSINELMKNIDKVPSDIKQKVINFGGGHANHSFFWEITTDKKDHTDNSWFRPYKDEFVSKGTALFGSGWVWLIYKDSKFEVDTTSNQDSPLMQNMVPVLGLDLWEHAYYLKYQNKRADYISAWFNVVNWQVVTNSFKSLSK